MIRKSMPSATTRWVSTGFPKRSCAKQQDRAGAVSRSPVTPIVIVRQRVAGVWTKSDKFLKRIKLLARRANQRGLVLSPVQPLLQKYFCFSETKIKLYDSPSRPSEGRWPSSRTLGRDAVDAAAPARRGDRRADFRGRSRCAQTKRTEADGEVVWS